jgi:hypothetical protein
MPENHNSEPRAIAREDIPRMEPWLAVSLLSFVPAVGLFILPPGALIPLYVTMAVLLTTGIGMFLRSESRKKRD